MAEQKDIPMPGGWPGQDANIHLVAGRIQDSAVKTATEILVR